MAADAQTSMAMLEAGLSDNDLSSSSAFSSDLSADEATGYGSDLFIDDDDRQRLMAMPELQREQILLRRKEQIDKNKERAQAQIKWRLEQRKKRKLADAADSSIAHDRSRREKPRESSKDAAMEDIRGRRRKQIQQRQSEMQSYAVDDDYADEDDEQDDEYADDQDDEYGGERPHKKGKTGRGFPYGKAEAFGDHEQDQAAVDFDVLSHHAMADAPIDHATMRAMQLRRPALESLIDEPFADDVIPGMFVRIGLGTNDATGDHVYRAVRIASICEYPRRYQLTTMPRTTSKAVTVEFGSASKTFKITQVSSHSITQREALQWVHAQTKDGLPVPTIGESIKTKVQAEKVRRTFLYTPSMVDDMIARRDVHRGGRSHNTTQQKFELHRALQIAKDEGDVARVTEVESRLDDLNEYISKMKRRQDNALVIEQVNQRIRRHNKLLDLEGDRQRQQRRDSAAEAAAAAAAAAASEAARSRRTSMDDLDDMAAPASTSKLQPVVMTPALRALMRAHAFPLQIDVTAPSKGTGRRSYADLHPCAFLCPLPFADRRQFTQTLSLREWRQKRGLE
ncbi:Plus3 domain-containing protein [Plasmodiophora brassicae]|uniref:Plus3 domain-containing protein n=1 Tax=Plasmodiophora brassicae TaxID=37360 RepID=A0A0G4J8C6_PLABS|nr:hypothetical protein PBRA_009431 [Plasmodiophora brassicae]SPQ93145.1 unnamed protein product [Plasmodiophora brassicae]